MATKLMSRVANRRFKKGLKKWLILFIYSFLVEFLCLAFGLAINLVNVYSNTKDVVDNVTSPGSS